MLLHFPSFIFIYTFRKLLLVSRKVLKLRFIDQSTNNVPIRNMISNDVLREDILKIDWAIFWIPNRLVILIEPFVIIHFKLGIDICKNTKTVEIHQVAGTWCVIKILTIYSTKLEYFIELQNVLQSPSVTNSS